MLYLNNAASTYPKPQTVIDAINAALTNQPAPQFRGAGLFNGRDVWGCCRENLGKLLGINDTERIFFSSGSTESLNILLCGLDLAGKQILTTAAEHNSVLRPLFNQPKIAEDPSFAPIEYTDQVPIFSANSKIVIVPCDCFGHVSPADIEKSITTRTGAIVVNHCSNVTGVVQDMAAIGKIAKKHGLLFIADVSQSAGCLPIHADAWGVDALAFTGHKSLYGIQGTGGYFVRRGLSLSPLLYGGTGRNSAQLFYEPEDCEYEVGTQNFPGISALLAGTQYILDKGLKRIALEEHRMISLLYERLSAMPSVRVFSDLTTECGPLISFSIGGLRPADVAYILTNGYGISVRTGLHCAPLIHPYLGSAPDGTVRVSVSDQNTINDISKLLEAIQAICMSKEDSL